MSRTNTGLLLLIAAAGLSVSASGCNVPPEEDVDTETAEPAAIVARNSAQPETRRKTGVVSWDIKKTSKDFWVVGLGANGGQVFRARLKPWFNGQGIVLSVKKPAKQIIAIRGQEILNCNDVRNCVPLQPARDLDARVKPLLEAFVADLNTGRAPYGNDNPCTYDAAACAVGAIGCAQTINPAACYAAAVACGKAVDTCDVVERMGQMIDEIIDECGRNTVYCPTTEVPY